jgi:Holliday junction resolvasome RuvABC endonuclease subunit
MSPVTIGIDYSMSSPAIAVHTGDVWSFDSCQFYFLTSVKKFEIKTPRVESMLYKNWQSNEERFDYISSWSLNIIKKHPDASVFIEDYAFAAKGVVFHIGECAGTLKHKLWLNKFQYKTFSPPSVKKFASGKGNANKIAMHDAFINETAFNITATLDCKVGDSPASDVIDAYYVAKYGFSSLSTKNS